MIYLGLGTIIVSVIVFVWLNGSKWGWVSIFLILLGMIMFYLPEFHFPSYSLTLNNDLGCK
jgi:hypothetical protein